MQNITNLDGQVDTRFSETLQNIATNSFDILDLRDNVTSLTEDVDSVSSDITILTQDVTGLSEDLGLEIMSLNHSIISLNQDVSVKLNNLNLTQVRNFFSCS